MTDEKELKYKCSECGKDVGVVFVVREDGKIINKCQKCFYGKPDNKN